MDATTKKTRRYGLLAAAAIISAGAASAACGASSESTSFGAPGDGSGSSSGAPPEAFGDGGSATPTGRADQPSNGVMLVHAADFPPLRVCFEGRPEAQPIPNATTMPDANIVGLDIGTGIRLAPIQNGDKPLGKVFVIEVDPNRIRNGFDESATCGQLICKVGTGPQCLTPDRDYSEAGSLPDAALGVSRLTVLAVKGCGNGFQIGQIGVPQAECGPGYDVLKGNVSITRIDSLELRQRPKGSLPVQLVNLSSRLAPGLGAVTVTYGALAASDAGADGGDAGLSQVANKPDVDVPEATQDLPLPADESVYGTHGFVVDRRTGVGDAFTVKSSLADVQEDSSPLSLPADYYATASNYALLLLGDPRAQQPNDPRRVHLIAVPMTDPADAPSEPDGGATTGDAGTGNDR